MKRVQESIQAIIPAVIPGEGLLIECFNVGSPEAAFRQGGNVRQIFCVIQNGAEQRSHSVSPGKGTPFIK